MIMNIINKYGVCMNPKIIFRSNTGDKAWDYTEITVAKIEDKWYYGFSYPSCSSSCSINNSSSFETEQQAIDSAYLFVKNKLECKEIMDIGFKHNGHKHLKEMIKWWSTKNQLTIF